MGIKTKINPYKDQASNNYLVVRTNSRGSRRSVQKFDTDSRVNEDTRSETRSNQSLNLSLPFYGDKKVDMGKQVSFGENFKALRNMNDALKERNHEIMKNLEKMRDEMESKNRIRIKQLKETYDNMANNHKTLLRSFKGRNSSNMK